MQVSERNVCRHVIDRFDVLESQIASVVAATCSGKIEKNEMQSLIAEITKTVAVQKNGLVTVISKEFGA